MLESQIQNFQDIHAEPTTSHSHVVDDVLHVEPPDDPIAGGIINPLRAKFFRENINIYLHFMSFLHINKTQVIDIPP